MEFQTSWGLLLRPGGDSFLSPVSVRSCVPPWLTGGRLVDRWESCSWMGARSVETELVRDRVKEGGRLGGLSQIGRAHV